MPRLARARTIASGAASSVRTTLILSVGQNVAKAARSHFVWSTIAMTSRAAATIDRLIWASSSVASARPDSRVKPGRAEERLLDVDPAEQPVAELADDRQRLPADAPAEHEHRDPGVTGQLRGDPEAVRDDRQLAPAAARLEVASDGERRRARVQDDALAVLDEGRARRADPQLLVRLEPFADLEGELRSAPVDRDRAAVRPDEPCSASRATRSLRIVTAETPN